MDERREFCTSHRKDTERIMDDVEGLKQTIYGNGKPGLKSDLIELKTNFTAVGNGIKISVSILGVLQILVGVAIALLIKV
jgi:hypothetical protein